MLIESLASFSAAAVSCCEESVTIRLKSVAALRCDRYRSRSPPAAVFRLIAVPAGCFRLVRALQIEPRLSSLINYLA